MSTQKDSADQCGRSRQFSLKTLLGVMMMVGLVAGFCVFMQRRHDAMVAARHRVRFQETQIHYADNDRGLTAVVVVAPDNKTPVPNVGVDLTLIGPDGGDGGFQTGMTDAKGRLRFLGPLRPGRYQYSLTTVEDGELRVREWRRGDPYLRVLPNGDFQPAVLECPP